MGQFSVKNNKLVEKSGNILLIDDKGVDGWNDIIDRFISSSYTSVNFFTLEEKQEDNIFKDKDIEELQQSTKTKINECGPDIILLDLRLLEHIDNNQEKVLEISGIKLLKYIKKLNPSIQVIVFSASTDSLILDELYANGILGYIKKDSPTNKYLASKNSLTKLDKLIKQGLERRYLKAIWETQQNILQLPFLTNNSDSIIFELRKNIASVFDVLNSNMPNAFIYSMLAIYKCIELINDYYVDERYDKETRQYCAYWRDTNIKINNQGKTSTENKIINILHDKLELSELDNTIKQIVCSRNYAIHPKEKPICKIFLVKQPSSENILEWFKMLYSITKVLK